MLTPLEGPRLLEQIATALRLTVPDLGAILDADDRHAYEIAVRVAEAHRRDAGRLDEAARVWRSMFVAGGCLAPGCDKPLPVSATKRREYCSPACKARARRRRQRDAAA